MSRRVFEERDYYSDRGPSGVRIRERDVEEVDTVRRGERLPHFMQSDYRREEQGPLVVRSRPHERSPSEVRITERFVERERSPSPERERVRARVVERREREPSQVRRVVETRERIREREREPSPPVIVRERLVERLKSPSPPPVERIRTRIIEREKKEPSPSPSPSPPPLPIIAPPIHQEIITHHRHIDHGFERPKAPSPPPPPRRSERTKETDIDIYTSRNNTEVDIRKTIRSRTPEPPRRRTFVDDNYIYEQERDKLKVRDERLELTRRRSVSSRPRERSRSRVRVDIDDEAEYYAKKTEKRAYIGEAYNGATKDWTIVDVPPGTERVRMDGVGGGSQEITWQRYNGVRRSKFIPEREREKERERIVERVEIDEPRRSNPSFEIEISTKRKEGGATYERDYERIEETTDRRVGPRGPKGRVGDLWTEITKDLVIKEAIEELGYDYEETEYFFYVLEYLRYEDVLELVELSEDIRNHRRDRIREITYERDRIREDDRWAKRRDHDDRYDDERVVEREIIYDGAPRRRRGDW